MAEGDTPEQVGWDLKKPFIWVPGRKETQKVRGKDTTVYVNDPRSQIRARLGPGGLILHYVRSREVQKRLDEVVGQHRWQSEMRPAGPDRFICRIGVDYLGDGTFIWKADGADDTDIEAAKGGMSDAFKRAAVHHGIGRYLYRGGEPMSPEEYEHRYPRP